MPWCEYQDGHPGLWHPGDQQCVSGHPDVDTGTADVSAYAVHRHHGSDEHGPADAVAVGLVPHHHGTGVEVFLTRVQALAYAELIRTVALLLPADDAGVTR